MKQALNDASLRQRLAVCGRTLVERLNNWQVITRHLEEAYQMHRGAGKLHFPADGTIDRSQRDLTVRNLLQCFTGGR